MTAKSVLYIAPSGNDAYDLTPETLSDLVFNTEQSYWTEGSGCGTLEFLASPRASLFFTLKEPLGFSFIHRYAEDAESWTSWEGGSCLGVTSVFSGGDFFNEPINFFVCKELALDEILEFCDSGGRIKSIQWKRLNDVDMPGDDELYGDPY